MLKTIDLSKKLSREEYERDHLAAQLALREQAYWLYEARRSMVVVFEGWDASGKGGNIRRLTEKLDPRGFHVHSIGAPDGDDAKRHYLWRFWRRLIPPDEKQIVIFDRSWYGRVLVERVEGLAKDAEWRRAYREINDFERQLVASGVLLVKFWLHISREEQLRRFERRAGTAYKRWKLTDEDWRNREKWEAYEGAVQDMLRKTSTRTAPWTVVEANDKRFARVKTITTLVEVIQRSFLDDKDLPPSDAQSASVDTTSSPDEDSRATG